MKKFTNLLWINECKTCINMVFPVRGQEYIDEAEHQDGAEYWAQFENISSVLADVKAYHECSDDYQLALRHCLDLINNDYADIVADDDNQPDDIKENFKTGLEIINTTFGRLYSKPANPCADCFCQTCSECADCYGCKDAHKKSPDCTGVFK